MPLQPWTPLRLLDLDRRIDEAFLELIHEPWGRPLSVELWQPAVDVHETEEAYLIEADLPGVPPDAVQLDVEEDRVTLRGSRHSVAWSQEGRTMRVERAQGKFLRTLEFEEPIDVDHVERQFEQGLLRIRLPKLRKPGQTN